MKQITVEVLSDGSIKIEAAGFQGASCEKATAAIERALGVPGAKVRKPEFYQQTQQQQKQGAS